MAQWSGQFSGHTHDTKVQDAELSLRKAVDTLSGLSQVEQTGAATNIRLLAQRLLRARLKALRARASSLSEPGTNKLNAEHVLHLRERVGEVQAQGIEGILKEFGV